jgi:hypothetical protein
MPTRTYWEAPVDGGKRCYYVRIVPGGLVVVGEQSASAFADSAGCCASSEFLAGQFHDFVLSHFGPDILAEMVEALRTP